MIRNLKVLIAAAMALAAFGAIGASGAQAAEFHCSVEPCEVTVKPDGTTGKEKHHVFVIKQGAVSVSSTCESIEGSGVSAKKTVSELTFTNIVYKGCNIAGTPGANVDMNGCDYLFKSNGEVNVACPEGKSIEITLSPCVVKIAPQAGLKEVKYTNINSKKEITLTTAVKSIKATASGCAGLGIADGSYNESEYSTGNTIVFAEGGASVWWE